MVDAWTRDQTVRAFAGQDSEEIDVETAAELEQEITEAPEHPEDYESVQLDENLLFSAHLDVDQNRFWLYSRERNIDMPLSVGTVADVELEYADTVSNDKTTVLVDEYLNDHIKEILYPKLAFDEREAITDEFFDYERAWHNVDKGLPELAERFRDGEDIREDLAKFFVRTSINTSNMIKIDGVDGYTDFIISSDDNGVTVRCSTSETNITWEEVGDIHIDYLKDTFRQLQNERVKEYPELQEEVDGLLSRAEEAVKTMRRDNGSQEKVRLFVDMDGVLARFNPVDTLETLYEPGYFLNLEPQETVIEAVKKLARDPRVEVFILSSVLSDSPFALSEKRTWLANYLPEVDAKHQIFPPCGEDKKRYVPDGIRETDCLLDDYTINLSNWEPPAKGIKLLNGINHTKGTWQGAMVSHELDGEELYQELSNSILAAVPDLVLEEAGRPIYIIAPTYYIDRIRGRYMLYAREVENGKAKDIEVLCHGSRRKCRDMYAKLIAGEVTRDEVEEPMEIAGHLCRKITVWAKPDDTIYIMGNCVDDNSFYYACIGDQKFEFDRKPTKEEVESRYIDFLAMQDIDRHEEMEFSAPTRKI